MMAGAISALAVMALTGAGCAAKVDADPPNVSVDIAFPSASAAVAIDSVRVYVFDGDVDCLSLVQKRVAGQDLPPRLLEKSASPCALTADTEMSLDIGHSYTFLATGEASGNLLLVGCSLENSYGKSQTLPISLVLKDGATRVPETKCAKLSDHCNGSC